MSLLTLGAGLALAAPAVAADHPVSFGAYFYSPADQPVAVNDTVTFSGTFMNHPLVWAEGDFATTNTGASQSFQFTHPGTYLYYCQLHGESQNMRGVVRVPGDLHPARVSFATDPAVPQPGQAVTFTYTGDPDPDGVLVRWQWDLDGDGSLETTTTGPSASHIYAASGAITVRVRAIDNGHEASDVAEQAVTIAAAGAGTGGGSGAPGSGASGAADTTAPRATLVKLKGLKLSFRSSERASATATLRAHGRTIAKGAAKAKSGTISLRLRLTAAGRKLLPPGHRLRATLKLTLRDASGNRRSVTRTLTVKRA